MCLCMNMTEKHRDSDVGRVNVSAIHGGVFLQLHVYDTVRTFVSVSVAHTTVAGLRSISSSNFTICCMSLALE